MAKSTHYFTRAERKMMVITAFAIHFEAHGVVWLTAGEVGARIGLVYSSHLKGILFELESEGKLAVRTYDRPGIGEVREFSLAPGTFQLPRRRTAPIKSRGLVLGQMELGL